MTKVRNGKHHCCWCAANHPRHSGMCHYHDKCWRDMTKHMLVVQQMRENRVAQANNR